MGAEEFHMSGVLAVVTAGLYLSWNASEIFSQRTRLQANGTWDTVIFILNGIIFILIGLQLQPVIEHIQSTSIDTLLFYGVIVSLTVIIGRIIWVYPGAYIPRWFSKKIRRTEPKVNIRLVTVIAWSGMRGVVSLAAALALPLTLANDQPFENRSFIIFLTFCVILSTLVVQGLSLRPLIKLLGIKPDEQEYIDEQEARLKIAGVVINRIEEEFSLGLSEDVLNQIKTKYEIRFQRLMKDQTKRRLDEEQINEFHRIQHELLDMERNHILVMRREGIISEEALRKIEYELDLEETRLILEKKGK